MSTINTTPIKKRKFVCPDAPRKVPTTEIPSEAPTTKTPMALLEQRANEIAALIAQLKQENALLVMHFTRVLAIHEQQERNRSHALSQIIITAADQL